LPGTEESAEDRALSSALEIGVLTDDHRPIAARFDQRALETRGPDDLLRGRVRTDEADAIDAGMRHEPLADVTAAVDDVDDSLGKPRVRHDLHEVGHRNRRPLGRLHDDRVADRDARSDQLDWDQR